jgi:hypothetical protein
MQNKIAAELPNNHSADAAPTGLGTKAILEIGSDLHALHADVFTLSLKTKNFHWQTKSYERKPKRRDSCTSRIK